MIRRTLSIVLLLSVLIFSCTKDDAVTEESSGSNEDTDTSEEETASVVYNVNKTVILELINAVRKTGCTCGSTQMPAVSALAWDDKLAKAAFDHSADMKTNNYFNHTGLNGSTPATGSKQQVITGRRMEKI